MVQKGIIAGIVLAFRLKTVKTRIRIGTIFGNYQGLSGECFMNLVKGRVKFLECAVIPTMVEIESQYVRDISQAALLVFFSVSVARNHGGPGRIGIA